MNAGSSRIARLAESVGRPGPVRRAGLAAAASGRVQRRRPVARAFDTGAEIAVHTVADDPLTGSVSGGWTVLPGPASPPPGAPSSTASPSTDSVQGSSAAPSIGDIGSVGGVPSAPAAATPALAAAPGSLDATGDDLGADMSVPGTDEVAGWTITAPPAPDPFDDEAFAQDIQAILAHAQSVAASSPRMPLPEVPQAPPSPLPAAPQNGIGVATGHDVFDTMSAANAPHRFDQGPVSLSVDFDRLDQALSQPGPPPQDGPSTPAPTDAAPAQATQPVTQPGASTPPPPTAEPTARPPGTPMATPPAGSPATSAPAAGTAFKVTTDVPLVPQGPGLSCHAAACAAMVAWRDEVPPDPAALATATGYWERYADGRTAVHPDVFETFGLETASAGAPPAGPALRDLLDRHGPLFASGFPSHEHAVVIAGVSGDGTETGVHVDVVDPWAVGMTTYAAPNPGSTYTVPLTDLVATLGTGPEHHVLLAHLRKGSS